MVIVLDSLLAVARKLRLPFSLSLVGFLYRILLLCLVVVCDFWTIFVVGCELAISFHRQLHMSEEVLREGSRECFWAMRRTSIALVQRGAYWGCVECRGGSGESKRSGGSQGGKSDEEGHFGRERGVTTKG